MNWTKATHCLKKHNPTDRQTDSNGLWKVNLLFVMYVKRILIIITYTASYTQ